MSEAAAEEVGKGRLAQALSWLHAAEDALLALLLGAMVLLAPLQIFLRNFFDEGITWADPLLRVLVLWVGLLGAVSASRGNRHITVDILSRFIAPRIRAGIGVVTSGFTVGVSSLVAWHSWIFVQSEREYEAEAFSGMQAWVFEIVIPIAFAAIALRYVIYGAADLLVALGLREPEDESGTGTPSGEGG